MNESATATVERPLVKPDHVHHWRIEEPNGETSLGVCKICGATRAFKNWLPDTDYLTFEERRQAAA